MNSDLVNRRIDCKLSQSGRYQNALKRFSKAQDVHKRNKKALGISSKHRKGGYRNRWIFQGLQHVNVLEKACIECTRS